MHQVNFLPWRQKKLKRQGQMWGALLCLQLVFWTTGLVIISTLQTNQIGQYRGQLTEITHQLAELQRSIKTTDQAVQHHHQLSQLLRKKRIFMEQNQQYLQLFRQLPHLLPENSWLTAFSDDSGQLIFTAHSQNYTDISDLLDNLTDDTSLINVQLKKMITTEDHFKDFTIDANWSAGEPNEK
ncbi:type IV pilus biogenesis protein PilN [Xenorhabdus vietnamensis]|uniref:Type IV pilus biogenesis protein PilN n=1 Tax=Xenorhabdus vietnamensis TaxID=351656 RepID=A0A1Y2SBA8_9GAMM|nr:PilN domain-containing protein [Xenorhabdus vietnamensis]OTA15984.1 type IV pilus biogenesis protein PilN [Xenorhabdus vietnamensis]